MATDASTGYVAGAQDATVQPIFRVEPVRFEFDISASFTAAQVANNVLILALATNRLLRFDLDNAADIDDIDLPKRPAEIGVVRKLFLDPSASHLIVSTSLGENYYLHTQSRQPKALSRLKGVQIESIAWNPSEPTASTREILVGASDGNVYETYIEPSTEFYKREERYVKNVYNPQDGAVVGLYTDVLSARPDTRRVIVATHNRLLHFAGRTGRQGSEGSGSIYSRLFEGETPTVHEINRAASAAPSALALSPDSLDTQTNEKAFAWLNSQGIFNGVLLTTTSDAAALGRQVFEKSRQLPQSKLPPVQSSSGRNRTPQPAISSISLTQFHILALVDGKLTAINRLDESVVYSEQVLEPAQSNLGLFVDQQKNTFWLFTPNAVFEIVAEDEARDIWRILLKQGRYDAAQRYATTAEQKDAVASVTGDHLMTQGKFEEAAIVLGRSSKAFEDVALTFIDKGESDALRTYLLTKLAAFKKTFTMQRIMLASWLVELYMAKLNQLDDTISSKAELNPDGTAVTAQETQRQLVVVRKEFQDLCTRYKPDLNAKTIYEIITSHGREEELLFYANVIQDYNYVLSYLVQRERWQDAMSVLKKQTSADMFYKYSSVLMTHTPIDLVEVLMRQPALDAKRLIPALLNYNKVVGFEVPLKENQAIRYLVFCINHLLSKDPGVHNTLISMYASNRTKDESALLNYLELQSRNDQHFYDADFALRLCIANQRVRSGVHIYTNMSRHAEAVDLALKFSEIDLAATVADQPDNAALRKRLWLRVAKTVIAREKSIKAALAFLKRCDLLRIEDLIPFFPDFVIIDDFKEEICAALEDYSRRIDELKKEMDDSAHTAENIKTDIRALDDRYAIVEPGERCWKCRLPLLMRQFFVFPCQHSFHADCLGEMVMEMAGMGRAKRIRELQREVGRGVVSGKSREGMTRELDALVAGSCVLCSDLAVKLVDEPFVTKEDDLEEWAV